MYSNKFWDCEDDNDDNKIRILDNEYGEKILSEIRNTQILEGQIISQLEINKKALTRRINNNIKDLKDMVEKESYTIILDNQLEREFDPPIECENCEIALLEYHGNNEVNVNDSNNTILYKYNGYSKLSEFVIPNGCYSILELFEYINNNFPKIQEGDIPRPIQLTIHTSYPKPLHFELTPNLSVRITEDSILHNLGFEDKFYPPRSSVSSSFSSFKNNSIINIRLNCIKNGFINEEKQPIIHSFVYNIERRNIYFTQKINEKPSQLIYYPIKEKIKHFKVEIKDKDGNDITFCNTYLKFHIKK